MVPSPYVGRFAPSPSGPLHEGSLVAAMASFLDARAHDGRWLVRIEDVDRPRTQPGADRVILAQLQALGMVADAPPVYQSDRDAAYEAAFERLRLQGVIYGCACTRREIALASQAQASLGEEPRYPGTCRAGVPEGRTPRAWRVRMPGGTCRFHDRWYGEQTQDVAQSVGDVALRRADGLWAYQLAVVVDDAAQGVTDVVRGADLLSSTARQIRLAEMLGLAVPTYLHVPLVMDEQSGLKLSKQNHAAPLAVQQPLDTLKLAYTRLGLGVSAASSVAGFWQEAVVAWARRFGSAGR